MNIAIAIDREGRISTDTATCRDFMVYDIDAGEIRNRHALSLSEAETLGKVDIIHEFHPLDGVSVLIAAGMGRATADGLKAIGISPYVTDEVNPDAAVLHYLVGDIRVDETGYDRLHHFHRLNEERGFAPAAGTRAVDNVE